MGWTTHYKCLNAPFGARCFLAGGPVAAPARARSGLNAPFGARCFLAPGGGLHGPLDESSVLMHLLALGAFWRDVVADLVECGLCGLNAPFGARCFLACRARRDYLVARDFGS